MPEVAIVILNWNGLHFLQKFLPILLQYTDLQIADIYVADNASTDQSLPYIKTNHPQIKIIQLDRNYGFAEGYNRALAKLDHPYFVLLNSDVEVSRNWLEPMLSTLKQECSIAVCMPKIRSYDRKQYFEHAGAAGGFIDKFGYPFCRGRIFNIVEEDQGQYDTTTEIFWASGACFLIRSELYKQAGGLDEFFFAHMEEIDLCWRLKNMGYKIYFCYNSVIYHVGGGTLPKINHKKTYLNFRNNFMLLSKNLPARKYLRTILLRILLDVISTFYFLIKLNPGESMAVLKAHYSILMNLGYIIRARKKTIIPDQDFVHNQIYPHSIVFRFFLRRQRKFSELDFSDY